MNRLIVKLILPAILSLPFFSQGQNIFPTTGNVGIGTNSPQSVLDVITPVNGFSSLGNTYAPGNFSGIHFGYRESNNYYRKSALVFERTDNHNQGGNASGKIHFLLRNDGVYSATSLDDAVMTLDSDPNGNRGSVRVGIGTKSPQFRLDVNGGDIRLANDHSAVSLNGVYLRGYPNRYLWMISNAPTTEFVIGTAWDWDQQVSLQYTPGTIGNENGELIVGQVNKNAPGYTHGKTLLYTNGLERLRVDKTGNVGIGTTNPMEKLSVNGNIRARKLIISQQNWADDVFHKSYKLHSLSEVEKFIKTNHHLPEIPSAKEVSDKGIDVGKTQVLLLKKIEELTLYAIAQQKQINQLLLEIKKLKNE